MKTDMVNVVTQCENCRRRINVLYGCCICQNAFCIEHVLPEKHQCSSLSQIIRYWNNHRKGEQNYKIRKSILPAIMLLLTFSSILIVSIGVTSNNMTSRDPTYEDALQFISQDQTEKLVYRPGKYTCSNFAKDFQANAQCAGFKCGYVVVLFADWSHALNCFNTTDFGLIYVEPQLDEIINLTIGKSYWDRTTTSLFPLSYNDTITGFLVNW